MTAVPVTPPITEYLYRKATAAGTPLSGTFELTPVCNMDCKMCYVRLSRQAQEAISPLRSGKEWLKLGQAAKDAGMLYLLLTGGEPLLHPDFREIMEGLHRTGLLITVNSNGTLIDENTVAWLKNAPPMRFNISLYGTSDTTYDRLCGNACCPVLTVSAKGSADLYAQDLELLSDGVSFTAVSGGEKVAVKLPIPGKFTVYNALNVLGMAMQLDVSLADAAAALRTAEGVKGRVEVVPTPGKDYTILIDYAHTPDGLENVLSSGKGFCKGRLIAVFGCGGDRDPIKRPIMGKIGTDIADFSIITSDNPRTEDPAKIIEDIVKGIDTHKNNYEIIENRPAAIRHAMDIAQKNDIIILAGKGHETYQEINGVKHHLDEREVVAAYLEEMR